MELEGIEALLLASRQPQLNREFQLRIVQEPLRARMCGHGDKDRRPITPPLIAKLVCLNTATGEEVPVEDVDTSFFIMSADLRTDELEDANLIHPPTISNVGGFADRDPHPRTRHSHSNSISSVGSSEHSHPSHTTYGYSRDSASPGHHTSPSVSAASPPPFPTKRSASPPFLHHFTHPNEQFQKTLSSCQHPDEYPTPTSNGLVAGHSPAISHQWSPTSSRAPSPLTLPPLAEYRSPNKKRKTSPDAEPSFVPYSHDADVLDLAPASGDSEHEPVPNLIGSLHTSAFKLKDEDGAPGIFFFWPDLSVRTEGVYRLRLRFLSIGAGGARIDGGSPVVASTYSQPFTVSSAKRFEGMLDPTSMSKCFAKQGIRIPTRKVKSRKKRGDEEEADA